MSDTSAAHVTWPEGKTFAFTVFDDTDRQTLANGKPVYDLLEELGFRTTKSVWTVPGTRPARFAAPTCADPDYLAWTLALQDHGFEIAMHNATYHTSPREVTADALRIFAEHYGHPPRAHANHSRNFEGIYWGDARFSGWHRRLYNVLTRSRSAGRFEGHLPSSPLFWGDLCQQSVTYVRDFVFDEIDTLRACPVMPYHDPQRPYVRRWFASADGPNVDAYVRMLSERNQDRLEEGGGACIMYTHFAEGFVRDGKLEPGFVRAMEGLASRGGWFVPVSTLLDHIEAQRGERVLTPRERRTLERRWLTHTVRLRLRAALR
jgi:hypothetical protein